MNRLTFDAAWMLAVGLPAAALVVTMWAARQRHRPRRQWLSLAALRAIVLLILVLLAARPMWIAPQQHDEPRRRVALLIDRSESMSISEGGDSRYRQAVTFARDRLVPALARRGLEARAYLFAEDAHQADGPQIAEAVVDGAATDVAGAIRHAVASESPPPLAVIALSDGAATQREATDPAVTALLDNRVPFIGLGFGSDAGPQVVSVEEILAPSRVPPQQEFRLAVKLQATGAEELPAFDLLLERDGRLLERKTIAALRPPRVWQETFTLREELPARHRYRVRVLLPDVQAIRSARTDAEAVVTISDEQHWKVLFVQGGLTWDFKFLRIAARNDPALELSCLSRTSNQSHFFQAVDDSSLSGGFPATLEELANFRVVMLANLRPSELRPAQQELLVRFCRETGGGVLLLGGAETFNVAWRGSPLEQLLPVRFQASPRAMTMPFSLQLSPAALRHPVFQLSSDGDPLSIWREVPLFREYAHVESLKAGAEVLLEGPQDGAGGTRPPILAVQRYGAGRSAALCVATLWRWRLAKHVEPEHYDRFWQQLIRYLGGGEDDAVKIHLVDQQLEPGVEIRAQLEMRPDGGREAAPAPYTFRVSTLEQQRLVQQAVHLGPEQGTEVAFLVDEPGVYGLEVVNSQGIVEASRVVELKDVQREFARPARNMDYLRQWASISQGQALPAEECDSADQLVAQLQQQAEATLQQQPLSYPAGVQGGVLTLLLTGLAADWGLRRYWGWR